MSSTTTRTDFTFMWDGQVPTHPTLFSSRGGAQAYVDYAVAQHKAIGEHDHAAKYGPVVSRRVTIRKTKWEEAS